MATPYLYRAFGLTILSDLEIPGGVSVAQGAVDADIVVRIGPCAIGPVDAVNGPYSRSGEALLFDAIGVARYVAPASNQLWVEIYPNADSRMVIALLIATALPMVIWMRGNVLLHAAGVVPAESNSAIAIAGPSGVGKSTLALSLVKNGGCLVGDDSLRTTVADSGVLVSGLPANIFTRAPLNTERTSVSIPAASRLDCAPLAAIICLVADISVDGPVAQRLHGAYALEALLKNRHRPKVPAILGRDAELLNRWLLLCRASPIYELLIKAGEVAGSQRCLAATISDIVRSEQ